VNVIWVASTPGMSGSRLVPQPFHLRPRRRDHYEERNDREKVQKMREKEIKREREREREREIIRRETAKEGRPRHGAGGAHKTECVLCDDAGPQAQTHSMKVELVPPGSGSECAASSTVIW
jgi:hypothetical protein